MQLPTKEQIDAITDSDALQALLSDVDQSIEKMEVDLEFDTTRDDDWERRARVALTAHRICRKNLTKRLARVVPAVKLASAAAIGSAEAKAAKAAAKAVSHTALAAMATTAAEAKRLRMEAGIEQQRSAQAASLEKSRESTRRQVIAALSQMSVHRCFVAIAARELDQATFRTIYDQAEALSIERTEQAISHPEKLVA